MRNIPGRSAAGQEQSPIIRFEEPTIATQVPACRCCESMQGVGQVRGVGPLCLGCTHSVIDALLDLEVQLLGAQGIWGSNVPAPLPAPEKGMSH